MTQYQDTDSAPRPAPDRSTQAAALDRELRELHAVVEKQADEIKLLQRELRRLRNEIRLAVNSFNLRNHG